ncbi:4Fe-4S binding domain [Dehalogenimonas alkenigignens]|uniref:4Fe-4S binding domain n=1 Tax=Dehalogenimonas alkenigignens TaxID=1217799 RepID=A0A0W0GL52_9CHLR|nr:4Fe-4S binding protein [Dehalogenimonas alkenigignens]KTB49293.1 4Fe-4S binding domain [Dehalogenimonas alkenigignens]
MKQNNTPSAVERNLLDNRFIGGLMKSKWYPGIIQWPTALVFFLIMYLLLLGPTMSHSNFGSALTWILWWPLIPLVFLLFGRFWCAICPFGTINDLVQKYVGHNRPVPNFLKKYGVWIIMAAFIAITWADNVFGVIKSPWASGVLLLLILTGVVISGVFFERRAWCRHLCFLGGMSSNYSQTGMLALRGTPEKCAKCKVTACYKGNDKAPGCPMFEFPRTMDTSGQCNLCGYCVKSCPNNSLTLTVRPPTKELWSIKKPRFAAALLAVVIMGILFVQNAAMLEIWQSILSGLEGVLGTDNNTILFTAAFTAAIGAPILLLWLASLAAKKINGETVTKNFARFGYAVIALSLAGHISHNLFHLLGEGGSIVAIGATFVGATASVAPGLFNGSIIQVLQYFVIILGIAGSLYTTYRIAKSNFPDKVLATVLPFGALILSLGIVNLFLASMPMTHRM